MEAALAYLTNCTSVQVTLSPSESRGKETDQSNETVKTASKTRKTKKRYLQNRIEHIIESGYTLMDHNEGITILITKGCT